MADSTFANLTTATAPAATAILPMVASPFGVGDDHKITFDTVFTQLELTTTDGGLVIGGVAAPGVSAAGKAKIYFDSTSNALNLSQNGAAYSPFTLGGGQTGRLTYWQDARTVTTFAELQRTADGALQFNAIAAPAVSAAAKATLYFDNSANLLKLSQNAGAYANLITGGGTTNQLAYYSGSAIITGNAFLTVNAGSLFFNLNSASGTTQYLRFVNSTSSAYGYFAYGPGTTDAFEFGFSSGGRVWFFNNDPAGRYFLINNDSGSTRDIYLGSDGTSNAAATRGFVYLPSVLGTPSGVPANPAGYSHTLPTVIDETNYLWYGFINGAWRNLTGVYPSSVMNLNSIAVASGSASVTTFTTLTYQTGSSGNLGVTAANAAHTAGLFQGIAAQSAAICAIRQNATPGTGAFLDCQTSAPASLFTIDVAGQISKLRGVSYTWPSAQGAASTVLTNDGSGNLSWAAAGGGGTPGGSSGQVQYNNAGAFGGVSGSVITSDGAVKLAATARTSGSPAAPFLQVLSAADTGLGNQEQIAFQFGGDASQATVTRTLIGGGAAIPTWRNSLFVAPTIAASAAQTITTAATVAITGAPAAGTNATITNSYALLVESGLSAIAGTTRIGTKTQLYTNDFGTPLLHVSASGGTGQIDLLPNNGGWQSLLTVATGNNNAVMALLVASNAGLVEIGSYTNHKLQFKTNNTVRGQIDNAGLWTIGSSSAASAQAHIFSQSASRIAAQFEAAASNSAAVAIFKLGSAGTGDFWQAQNSSGTVLASLNASGSLLLGASNGSLTGTFTAFAATSATTTVVDLARLAFNSTGTPGIGNGGRLSFGLKTSTTNNVDAASIEWIWTDPTHATRTSAVTINVVSGGALVETARFKYTGVGIGSVTVPAAMLDIKPRTTNDIALKIDTPGATNVDLAQFFVNGSLATKMTKYGSLCVTGRQSSPALGDMIPSSFEFYLDEAGNNLKVKVLYSDGSTLKTGTIALV